MFLIHEKINNYLEFTKKKIFIILIICAIASILTVLWVPLYVKEAFTAEIIEKTMSQYFGGMIIVSIDSIVLGIINILQSTIMHSSLFILAYLYKYWHDKSIFRFNKWQDWKFFLFISVVPIISVDLLMKARVFLGFDFCNNLLINFIVMFLLSLIVLFFSSLIIEKEKKPIIINPAQIEKDLQ